MSVGANLMIYCKLALTNQDISLEYLQNVWVAMTYSQKVRVPTQMSPHFIQGQL